MTVREKLKWVKSLIVLAPCEHGSVYHPTFLSVRWDCLTSRTGFTNLSLLFLTRILWLAKKLTFFFYNITILSVKAEVQLFIVRTASTQKALVGKCVGARRDILSFMGGFKGSEIITLCFWKTSQRKKQHFHSPWLICISYLHSSPSDDIVSCRMTREEHLWSTLQLILYNACKLPSELVVTTGALEKHTVCPSSKQRGIFVEPFEET